MLVEEIESVIVTLRAPLIDEESDEGWTQESKSAIAGFFQNLLSDVRQGKQIPYVGLVRALDAWGVEAGGSLYERAMNIARKLNGEL